MTGIDFQENILLRERRTRSRDPEWRPQSAYAPERFEKVGSESIARRDAQGWHAVGPHQLCRHQKQALPEALQGGPLQMGWSTKPLEPVQQVVGQQDDLEERFVGREVFRRDLSQSVGVLQFPDDQLGPGALVVKAPEVE